MLKGSTQAITAKIMEHTIDIRALNIIAVRTFVEVRSRLIRLKIVRAGRAM